MSEIPSEKVQAKAAEYLLSGRVKVQTLSEDTFLAHVTPKDGGDPYHVKFNANGWHCDCLARVQVCAHVLACQMITEIEPRPEQPEFAQDPEIDKLLGT